MKWLYVIFVIFFFSYKIILSNEKEQGFIGISTKLSEKLDSDTRYNAKFGIKIIYIYPSSPAEKAGLNIGDIIIAINKNEFNVSRKKTISTFSKCVKNYSPGDTITLKIIRETTKMELYENGKKIEINKKRLYNLMKFMKDKKPNEIYNIKMYKTTNVFEKSVTLSKKPAVIIDTYKLPSDYEIHPNLKNSTIPEIKIIADKLINYYGFKSEYDDLRKRLAKSEETGDSFRRNEIAYIHRNPFEIRKVAKIIFNNLAPNEHNYFIKGNRILEETNRLFGNSKDTIHIQPLKTGVSIDEHLNQLEKTLKAAVLERKKAFSLLSEEEIKFLFNNLEKFIYIFENNFKKNYKIDEEKLKVINGIIKLASKIKYTPLINATKILLKITSPNYLAGLKNDLKNAGVSLSAKYIAKRNTDFGQIIIGGKSSNWYKKKDAAIIIDIGGNDFYTNNSGSSTKNIPCSILVDVDGNDAYEGTRNFVQGTGFIGIGILFDNNGNDSYIGLRGCQGSGFIGIGLLIDKDGNDVYRSHSYSQGCGLFGSGIIIELNGNDKYESHLYSQGVGIAGGIGILTDSIGDDLYYSKGTYPTSYGTPGVYEGWSQGCGVGFRRYASGGIGILQDGRGKDKMEAGNFSQGGGYYFGWGLLESRGNNSDTYIGSRYAQGFSAHYAIGTFLEEGGNDTYITRNGVIAGLAWDVSISLFEDIKGNDYYEVKNFSVGASAHNSITIFIDKSGTDKYIGKNPARAFPNSYHGGVSFSLFIDENGGKDIYTKKKNNIITCKPEYGCFIDLPFSIKDAINNKRIKDFIRPMKRKK